MRLVLFLDGLGGGKFGRLGGGWGIGGGGVSWRRLYFVVVEVRLEGGLG